MTTDRLLASTDVLVEKLWSFHTDEIETTFFRNGRGQKGLPTTREPV